VPDVELDQPLQDGKSGEDRTEERGASWFDFYHRGRDVRFKPKESYKHTKKIRPLMASGRWQDAAT